MSNHPELEHVLDIPVLLEAILPGRALRVGDLMALGAGSLINTGQPVGEAVEVLAAGALIGFAELTDAGDRRAVRMVRFHAGGK